MIPLCIASLSATLLVFHALWSKVGRYVIKKRPTEEAPVADSQGLTTLERLKVAQGGSNIFAVNIQRVLCLYLLAAVSLSYHAIRRYIGEDKGSDANAGFFAVGSRTALTITYVRLFFGLLPSLMHGLRCTRHFSPHLPSSAPPGRKHSSDTATLSRSRRGRHWSTAMHGPS